MNLKLVYESVSWNDLFKDVLVVMKVPGQLHKSLAYEFKIGQSFRDKSKFLFKISYLLDT